MPQKAKTVSQENKTIARHAAKVFGGTPHVREFLHDELPLAVDILSCVGRPEAGLTSYSTIGLSDHPMQSEEGEFPTRIELAGVMAADATKFHMVLGSAAFRIMRTRELVFPGRVMEGYVAEYYPETALPHLYFTAPFYWDEALNSLDCGTKQVAWLLGVPISDAELQFLLKRGDEAFEDLLQAKEADITDMDRPSVV